MRGNIMRSIDSIKMSQVNKEIDSYEQYYLTIGRPIVDEAVGELDKIVSDIKNYLNRLPRFPTSARCQTWRRKNRTIL